MGAEEGKSRAERRQRRGAEDHALSIEKGGKHRCERAARGPLPPLGILCPKAHGAEVLDSGIPAQSVGDPGAAGRAQGGQERGPSQH